MTDLWGTGLIEGLPPAVADEPWVRIMDKVYRERHQREMEAAELIHIYTQIDSQPEEILDVLAVQFKVDWYDSNYPLEAKRSIIKTALEVRRYYGTDWATLKAISAIYPRSEIEQWYDYGGTPVIPRDLLCGWSTHSGKAPGDPAKREHLQTHDRPSGQPLPASAGRD